MGIGEQAGDALSRVNYVLDWSNPLANVIDEIVRGVLKQFNIDELLEQVSGDHERLAEVALEWRQAARDLRGVVDDLQAERRTLQSQWTGEASKGFGTMMTGFEKSLQGEAEDMETMAQLLEMAAQECAAAEELMLELIVEIVQAVIAIAATSAVLSLLTMGAAAAIGPVIAGANIAYRAARGVRITARLAEKLADLARRMKAVRKAATLRHELRKGPKYHKKGLQRYVFNQRDPYGPVDQAPQRNPADLVRYVAHKKAKGAVRGGLLAGVGSDPVGAATGVAQEESPGIAERRYNYQNRPDPQSFDERSNTTPDQATGSVRDTFG